MRNYSGFAVVEPLISMNFLTKIERLNYCLSRGARHGIKMNGKLQRLQEQEERVSPSVEEIVEKKKKKKQKSLE